MIVRLVSEDPELCALCREVLLEHSAKDSQLIAGVQEVVAQSSNDICIWDLQEGIPEDPDWHRSGMQVFLVHPKDLGKLQERSCRAHLHILIKPVTRTTLGAFLSEALAVGEGGGSESSERDLMLQCLIQANLKLQLYDQQRTNFLARAVHDFRAPLTATDGYCGLLLSGPLGPVTENQREVLQRMQHSIKRLSRMASAMFELSVGRQLKNQVNLQREDLRECLDQALHEMRPFLEEKKIKVTVDLQPPLEDLYVRRSQIEQVFLNLLDNACKFTPKIGSIVIRGYPCFWERRVPVQLMPSQTPDRRCQDERQPNSYRIDVRDSGAGIPPEHLDRIFEEYATYSFANDRSAGGLGLAICKMILERHQGRIWAETSASGAVFSFMLPFRPAMSTVQQEQTADKRLQIGAA